MLQRRYVFITRLLEIIAEWNPITKGVSSIKGVVILQYVNINTFPSVVAANCTFNMLNQDILSVLQFCP